MNRKTTNTRETWNLVNQMNINEGFMLGPINAESIIKDPKHLGFVLARYKFAAKMMVDCTNIIDVGCGEGLGVLMFLAETKARIRAVDFDGAQILYDHQVILPNGQDRVTFHCVDMISSNFQDDPADGLVCIDVIEHIHPEDEDSFFKNCIYSLSPGGIGVWGTPSSNASEYASPRSQIGHINLYSPERLTETLKRYFDHVFLFSMNDEMIHTGFVKMAHYLMALCIKKN